jgi:hypothetical protein
MVRLTIRPLALVALALAALAAAVLVHPPKPAYACSCMMPPAPQEARDQAQAVFSGTASDVQPGKDGVLVTFDVARVWKGPDDARLTLATPASSASCGVEFVPGEEYLVYAFAQDGELSTNLCTRTAPLANAADDITALGEGAAPATGAPLGEAPAEPATPAATPWLPLALGAAAVLAAAAVAYTTLVRRER